MCSSSRLGRLLALVSSGLLFSLPVAGSKDVWHWPTNACPTITGAFAAGVINRTAEAATGSSTHPERPTEESVLGNATADTEAAAGEAVAGGNSTRSEGQRRLRVAVYTASYSEVVDGVSLTLNRMVRYLLSQGHEVVVLASDTPLEGEERKGGVSEPAGRLVRTEGLKLFWALGRSEYRFGTGLGKEARKVLDEFKPDILHSAVPDGTGGEVGDYAAEHGIPMTCTYHTRFNTYFGYYSFGFVEPVYWWLVRRWWNSCSMLLPPTQMIADELRENGLTAPLAVWPRGVDTALFAPGKRSEAWREKVGASGAGDVVVFFLSRIVLEKNLQHLVEALRQVKTRVVPVIGGDGAALPWLKQQLPTAHFLGKLTKEEAAEAFASSDIFFFPSTTETFGNVVLESLASGLPVVGANASGTEALVQHGTTGFLSNPSLPSQSAFYIDALASSPALRSRFSSSARNAAAGMTWDTVFQKLVGIYNDVLPSSGA